MKNTTHLQEIMDRIEATIAEREAAIMRLQELRQAEPAGHVHNILTEAIGRERSALGGNRQHLADLAAKAAREAAR